MSWILTVLALNGALMAALLFTTPGPRGANRILSILVALISLRMVIYVLGFAGAYDDHPWITFAPLDASLAFGPLLWLYLIRLTRTEWPPAWRWHFLPAGVQITYSIVAFAMPLPIKLAWYHGPHLDMVEPTGLAAVLVSCTVYAALAGFRQHSYQLWLDDSFADRERWRLGWITAILAAFAATVLFAMLAAAVNLIYFRLDYFSRTPVVFASSILAYLLGLLGWHHAALDLPAQPRSIPAVNQQTPIASRLAASFPEWTRRIETEQWWRESGLTLSEVASRLGTSERTLSRSLSASAGTNFNAYINGMRVEAVKRLIAADPRTDLLSLAFDCGFNSKASFNRAFLRHTGLTPSGWRDAAAQNPPIDRTGDT